MRMDFILIGLLLIISAIYSYFQGYIDQGIGFIMTSTGSYIATTGLFFKYENEKPPRTYKKLPYK